MSSTFEWKGRGSEMSSEQEEFQRLILETLKRERDRERDKTSFYLREVSPGFLQRLLKNV